MTDSPHTTTKNIKNIAGPKQVCLACNAYVAKYGKGDLTQAKMRFELKYLSHLAVPYAQEQRTPGWYKARRDYITASDVPTVCGNNAYKSVSDLLLEKWYPDNPKVQEQKAQLANNPAIQWGNHYEDEALEAYCHKTGHIVIQTGLLCNKDTNPLIAGSPDGVTLCKRVVEIKCPYTRSIPKSGKGLTQIPRHYEDQVKTCMSILRFKNCDFIQYRPKGYGLKGRVDPKRGRELLIIPYKMKTYKYMEQYLAKIERIIIRNKTIFATTIDSLASQSCLYFVVQSS
jgi:putative phage-type endonuclease